MNKDSIRLFGINDSQITVYDGIEGVRIVNRNSLNAENGLYVFEMTLASLNSMFPEKEAEELRVEFLRRKIKIKEITNKAFHEYTKVKAFHDECMDIRYLSPEKFHIQTEVLIYNDIVAFYSYETDIFAVEVKNQRFAQTQKNIFELLWAQAERPVINISGRSSIF